MTGQALTYRIALALRDAVTGAVLDGGILDFEAAVPPQPALGVPSSLSSAIPATSPSSNATTVCASREHRFYVPPLPLPDGIGTPNHTVASSSHPARASLLPTLASDVAAEGRAHFPSWQIPPGEVTESSRSFFRFKPRVPSDPALAGMVSASTARAVTPALTLASTVPPHPPQLALRAHSVEMGMFRQWEASIPWAYRSVAALGPSGPASSAAIPTVSATPRGKEVSAPADSVGVENAQDEPDGGIAGSPARRHGLAAAWETAAGKRARAATRPRSKRALVAAGIAGGTALARARAGRTQGSPPGAAAAASAPSEKTAAAEVDAGRRAVAVRRAARLAVTATSGTRVVESIGLLPGIRWSLLSKQQRAERTAEASAHLAASGYELSSLPPHRRIPSHDHVRGAVIRGDGAPKAKDATRFFARFPFISACRPETAPPVAMAAASTPAAALSSAAVGAGQETWLPRGKAASVNRLDCINPGVPGGAIEVCRASGADVPRHGVFLCITKIRSHTRQVSDADELALVRRIIDFFEEEERGL